MEQQIAVSEKLNPNRIPCEPFGIKARSTLNPITLTPSEASTNETLYVDIPKLAESPEVYILLLFLMLLATQTILLLITSAGN